MKQENIRLELIANNESGEIDLIIHNGGHTFKELAEIYPKFIKRIKQEQKNAEKCPFFTNKS